MTYTYYPKGVCSSKFEIDMEDGIITSLRVDNGCDGNLKGITRLVTGRPAAEVMSLLQGVRCGPKATSCPDQLSRALAEAIEVMERGRVDE